MGFVKKKIRFGGTYRLWMSRNDTHGDFSLEVIDSLAAEAMKDFPNLERKNIDIEVSDKNCSLPNTIGISFFVPDGDSIPAFYREYIQVFY